MAVIINSTSRNIAPQQYDFNSMKNVESQQSRNVLGITALAGEKDMLSLLFDKQSLHNDETRAMATLKRNGVEVKLSAANVGDCSKAERLAGAVASAMPAQMNITLLKNNFSESKVTIESQGITSTSQIGQTRSHPAVEGGVDITGVDSVNHHFINVLGDMKFVELNNLLTVTLRNSEAYASKASAESTSRVVDAAERAGNKGIAAEQKRLSGAITSGVMGIVAQGASTGTTMKALNKESKSITNNLGNARNQDMGLRNNQPVVHNSSDGMLSKGKPLDNQAKQTVAHPHAETMHNPSGLIDKHASVQLSTQKVRSTMELANQAIRSGQEVIQGTFGVEAAKESKQADLARADQTVNGEIANTQQQTAKKAAEARLSLHQVFESTLNANNSAASAIAERMR